MCIDFDYCVDELLEEDSYFDDYFERNEAELERIRVLVERGLLELPDWIAICEECGHLKVQSLDKKRWYHCDKCKKSW